MVAGMAHGPVAFATVAGLELKASSSQGNHQVPYLSSVAVNFSYPDNAAMEGGEKILHLAMTKITLRMVWLAMATKEAG